MEIKIDIFDRFWSSKYLKITSETKDLWMIGRKLKPRNPNSPIEHPIKYVIPRMELQNGQYEPALI